MDEQDIVETILENRGIKDVEHFLHPQAEDMLPLGSMKNEDKAAKIVVEGIAEDKQFGVFFDVDTDGVSAGTIMTRYLRNFTDKVSTYINSGKAHGLIGQQVGQFGGVDILIIVDSLDKDVSQYKKLVEMGMTVIVLDHHAIDPEIEYDNYVTLVSSQRDYDNPQLSGAGVVWKFCMYLDEFFGELFALDLVDLAACGILADVCEVSEERLENRYIVSQGLNNLKNPAMKKILGSYEFNSKAILFSIAPLINAACRFNENEVAMDLFLEDENKEVLRLKKILEGCKEQQTELLNELLPKVCEDFEAQKDSKILYTVIDTPYGISGVIGNKCLEMYNKPLLILKERDNMVCGSMRSVGYGDFMKLCNDTGLAVLHGHEQASGIEISVDNFEEFIEVINKKLSEMQQTTTDEIEVDCEIALSDLTRMLVDKVKAINYISGAGFKPLVFKVVDMDEYGVSSFKEGKHLVLTPREDVQLIEWNTNADYDALEDNSMMNDPLEVIGELDSGFFCRKFMLKVIMSDWKVGAA